ncbi:MAG: response regulator transcription factor [Actinomycetaceae bacterium]|nr:response regulator transcription factor [Actinomycetaceae bacterium]
MINVVVVDDQAMVRAGLVALLSLEDDLDVVGQAASGQELLNLVDHLGARGIDINVVLMDIEMPGMDGLAATEALTAAHPGIKVLIVTTFGRPGYFKKAVQAGAKGFMVKDTPAAQLAAALRTIAEGAPAFDPDLAVESLALGDSPLTARQTEVLRALAKGGDISEIAREIHLSEGTVRNHISAILAKTGAKNRTDALRTATNNGWL